jgi:hypothetical protein
MNSSSVNLYEPSVDVDEGQMETAKRWFIAQLFTASIITTLFFLDSLRARFEQMQQEKPKLPNTRIKVNRFVVSLPTRLLFSIPQFSDSIAKIVKISQI